MSSVEIEVPEGCRVLSDKVLIQREFQPDEEIRGGLIIPDIAREKPSIGRVLAHGPGRWEFGNLIPMSVQIGDRVIFGKYSGMEVSISGEKCLMMPEGDIQLILPS